MMKPMFEKRRVE